MPRATRGGGRKGKKEVAAADTAATAEEPHPMIARASSRNRGKAKVEEANPLQAPVAAVAQASAPSTRQRATTRKSKKATVAEQSEKISTNKEEAPLKLETKRRGRKRKGDAIDQVAQHEESVTDASMSTDNVPSTGRPTRRRRKGSADLDAASIKQQEQPFAQASDEPKEFDNGQADETPMGATDRANDTNIPSPSTPKSVLNEAEAAQLVSDVLNSYSKRNSSNNLSGDGGVSGGSPASSNMKLAISQTLAEDHEQGLGSKSENVLICSASQIDPVRLAPRHDTEHETAEASDDDHYSAAFTAKNDHEQGASKIKLDIMALSNEIHNESMVASPRFHPEHDTGKTTTMRPTIEHPTSAPAGPPAYQMSPLEFLARSAVAAMNLIPAYAPRLYDDDDDENDDAIGSRYVARKRNGSSNTAKDAPTFEVDESQANNQQMTNREESLVTQDVAQDAEELVVTQDVAQDEYNEQNAEKLSSLPELIAKECILAVSEKDNIAITPCIAEGDDPGPGAFSRNFPEQSDDADPPLTSTLQEIYETQPATETKTPEAAACTNVEAMTPPNETNADQSKAMQTDFSSPLENMHLDDGATAIDTMDVDEDQFAAKSEVASIDADADLAQHEVSPEAMTMAVTTHIDEAMDEEKESFTDNESVFPNVGAVESSKKTGDEVSENYPLVLNKEVGAMESSKATCDGEEIATENSQKSGITEQNVQNVKNQSVSEQSFAEPSTCADDNNEAFVPEAGDMGTASQLTEVITPQKEIPVSTESDVTNKPQISSMNLTQEKHLNETVPMEIDDAASNNVDATTTSPFSTPGPERVTHSDSDSHGSADAELPGPANAQSPIDDFYEHTLHHVDNLIFPPIIPDSSANIVDSWPAKTFRILNLDRLKLKLYMEGRRTHQCQEYERRFSKYWAALSIRLEEELSPSNVHKCEAILQSFLTTKKLRRLHNKLILGLMERCSRPYTLVDLVDERFPAAWKDRVQITTLERLHEGSGQPVTPTPSVVAAQVKEPCEKPAPAAVDFAYHLIEHDTPLIMEFEAAKASTVLPVSASSRLPGALVVDPYVRSLCTSKNMKVSENAVWLLVIAMKHFAVDCLTQALEASRTVEDLHLSLPDEHTSLNLGDTRKFSTEHARCPHKQQRSEQKCRLGAADFHSLLFGMPFKQSVVNSHSRVAFEGSLHSSLDQYAGQDISGMDIIKRFLTDRLSVFTPAQEKHQPSTPAIVSSVACPALSEERTSTPVASGGLGRGAKDLASLKAKTSKPEAPGKITSPFATATEDAAIARPLSSETAPIAAIADANDTPFTSSPGDKSDGGKQSGRRGKGFGVKNLAAMRARSVTSTTDENTIKAAAVVTAAAAAEDDDDNEEFKGDIQDESTIKAAAVVAAVAAEEDDNEEEREEVKDDIQASAGVDVDGDAELIAEVNLSPAATEQLPAAPNETQRNVE